VRRQAMAKSAAKRQCTCNRQRARHTGCHAEARQASVRQALCSEQEERHVDWQPGAKVERW